MEGRVPHYYAMSLNESFKDRWHLRWTTNVKSLLDKGLTYPHNASSETFKFLIVQYCQSKFSILTLLHPNSLLNSKCYYMLRSERHPKAVYYFYIVNLHKYYVSTICSTFLMNRMNQSVRNTILWTETISHITNFKQTFFLNELLTSIWKVLVD